MVWGQVGLRGGARRAGGTKRTGGLGVVAVLHARRNKKGHTVLVDKKDYLPGSVPRREKENKKVKGGPSALSSHPTAVGRSRIIFTVQY